MEIKINPHLKNFPIAEFRRVLFFLNADEKTKITSHEGKSLCASNKVVINSTTNIYIIQEYMIPGPGDTVGCLVEENGIFTRFEYFQTKETVEFIKRRDKQCEEIIYQSKEIHGRGRIW